MKKFSYILICLLLVSFLGCHPTWWEVKPVEVYSPADFSKLYKVTLNHYGEGSIEFTTNLRNRTEDTLGIYLYNNLSLLQLQLKKETETVSKSTVITNYEWMKSQIEAGLAKNNISSINTDISTFYILPVLRNYITNTSVRNYFSNDYLKVQFAPWSRLSTLSFNGISTCLFSDNSSLLYVNNDGNNIYFYRLDSTVNRFNQVGISSDININRFAKYGDLLYINKIAYGYFNDENNKYHLLINTIGHGSGHQTIGDLILDSNFNIIDYQMLASGNFIEFKKVYKQNDTLHLLYNYPITRGIVSLNDSTIIPSLSTLTRSAIALKTGKILFSYNIYDKNNVPDSISTIAFLGSEVLLKYKKVSNFIHYSQDTDKKLKKEEVNLPSEADPESPLFAIEKGRTMYLGAGAGRDYYGQYKSTKLYKVYLNGQNKVAFEDTGLSALRKSDQSAYQTYNQGLFYQGNITLLYNPTISFGSSEVWQVNPNRTRISFDSLYTEVVRTNR